VGSVIRTLTEAEQRLAREAFGAELQLNTIRLIVWPFRRAFVAGRWFGRDWIVWPHRELVEDFATASSRMQGVLVHELTHVWQAQQGVNLLFAKLKAGDSAASYAYEPRPDCRWDALNIEQQAMVMEHRFHCLRGNRTPGDRAFYDAICPFEPGNPVGGCANDRQTPS
jgi:hypothetical protein